MKIIVCVDDNDGVLFYGKRQSMDLLQREYVSDIVGKDVVYLSNYTYELYKDLNLNFEIIDDETKISDGYFIYEGEFFGKIDSEIEEILLFKWNRNYPFDKTFDLYKNDEFKLIESNEFIGKSHEKITFERYMVKYE